MNRSKTLAFTAILAVLGLLAGIFSAWAINQSPERPPQLQTATPLGEQARPLPKFSLVDHNGETFGKPRVKDHWSFLFFGYTHCPDICPTTLNALDQAMQTIEKNSEDADPRVVFISVDPARDTPEKLQDYVSYFNPEFIGVTGEPAALRTLTSDLGIVSAKILNPRDSKNDPDNYLVDHSASIMLIDPQGRLAAVFGAPHEPDSLAADFLELRDYYRRS